MESFSIRLCRAFHVFALLLPVTKEISYEDLKALLGKSQNLFLVDVRSKEEVDKGHIQGSVHIPGELHNFICMQEILSSENKIVPSHRNTENRGISPSVSHLIMQKIYWVSCCSYFIYQNTQWWIVDQFFHVKHVLHLFLMFMFIIC